MSPNYTELFAARREMKNPPGVNRYLSGDDGGQATARHLVDVAMPPIMWSRWHLRARKIWIADALGGNARCRLDALRQGYRGDSGDFCAGFLVEAPLCVTEPTGHCRLTLNPVPST